MPNHSRSALLSALGFTAVTASSAAAQQLTAGGKPARLEIRQAGPASLRITLKPVTYAGVPPVSPGVVSRTYPTAALSVTSLATPVKRTVGTLAVDVRPNPLTV